MPIMMRPGRKDSESISSLQGSVGRVWGHSPTDAPRPRSLRRKRHESAMSIVMGRCMASQHRRQANKKDGTLLFRKRFDFGERSVPPCKHCTTLLAAIYGGGKYPTKWVNLARKCGTLPSILDKTAFHQVHLLSNL